MIPIFAQQPFGWGVRRSRTEAGDILADRIENPLSLSCSFASGCPAELDQRLLCQAPMRLFGAEVGASLR